MVSYRLITGNPLYDNPFLNIWIIYFVSPYADYCIEYSLIISVSFYSYRIIRVYTILHFAFKLLRSSAAPSDCFILRVSFGFTASLHSTENPLGKALVLLVSLALICCHTYSYDLSTKYSVWGLTWLPSKRTHLLVGFVLICFQHLSASNTATGRLPLAG